MRNFFRGIAIVSLGVAMAGCSGSSSDDTKPLRPTKAQRSISEAETTRIREYSLAVGTIDLALQLNEDDPDATSAELIGRDGLWFAETVTASPCASIPGADRDRPLVEVANEDLHRLSSIQDVLVGLEADGTAEIGQIIEAVRRALRASPNCY